MSGLITMKGRRRNKEEDISFKLMLSKDKDGGLRFERLMKTLRTTSTRGRSSVTSLSLRRTRTCSKIRSAEPPCAVH